MARLVARVLIAALVFALLPPRAEASIPVARVKDVRLLEDLAPKLAGDVAATGPLRVVVIVATDPSGLTESAFGELLAHTGTDPPAEHVKMGVRVDVTRPLATTTLPMQTCPEPGFEATRVH